MLVLDEQPVKENYDDLVDFAKSNWSDHHSAMKWEQHTDEPDAVASEVKNFPEAFGPKKQEGMIDRPKRNFDPRTTESVRPAARHWGSSSYYESGCYICGSTDHWQRDCPQRKGGWQSGKGYGGGHWERWNDDRQWGYGGKGYGYREYQSQQRSKGKGYGQGYGPFTSRLGSLSPPCKPNEPIFVDEPLPDLPASSLLPPKICGLEPAGEGRAVKSFEGSFIVGNIQDGLKSPRHSYHQWQVPDAPRLQGGSPQDIPDDVAIAPNRLLHEIKHRQFQDFLEEIIYGQPRKFKKDIELHRRILNVSEGPGKQAAQGDCRYGSSRSF
eukprot:s4836_g3.t1